MDTKTIIVTLVCAVLGSSALTPGRERCPGFQWLVLRAKPFIPQKASRRVIHPVADGPVCEIVCADSIPHGYSSSALM